MWGCSSLWFEVGVAWLGLRLHATQSNQAMGPGIFLSSCCYTKNPKIACHEQVFDSAA